MTAGDGKIYYSKEDMTSLVRVLIKVYKFRNRNQAPTAVVLPDLKEVDGIPVEVVDAGGI